MRHRYRHPDGTTITISGPQADKAAALIKAAPAMLAFLTDFVDTWGAQAEAGAPEAPKLTEARALIARVEAAQ